MATYIKGVTDVLPGPTAMAPDYKLLGTALATLQNKYDKGFNEVKSMYSSMINRELSSSDNEKFRQDYLKKADAELSRFSGIDLSNPNNVSQAMNVFKPLVNDKQYVKDLFLTQSQNSEISKMESVKSSSDSKIREGYDPKMEEWLYLGKKRLSGMKRDDGSIESANYNKFAPWEDPIAYGMKMAKEQGLEIGRTEFEGMFIKHITGGDQAVGPYKNWFKTVIGDKFDNQFRIEAELDYEHGVQNLMAKDKTLDRQAATQQLAQDFSGNYVKLMNDEINDTQTRIDQINDKIKGAKLRSPNGLSPNDAKVFQALAKQKIQLEDRVGKLKKEKGADDEFQQKAVDLFVRNPAGTYVNKIKDDYATQFGLAKATTKVDEEVQVNQAALQRDKQKHDWAMMMKKAEIDMAHDLKMKEIDRNTQIEVATLKGETLASRLGAAYGNEQSAGSYTLDYAYTKSVNNNLNNGIKGYVDDKVLAVAANLKYTGAGIATNVNDGLNMGVVKQAIIDKGQGKQLGTDAAKALANYLSKVKPGFQFNAAQHTFADIQALIDYGFGANQKNTPTLAKQALPSLQAAGNAWSAYTSQFIEEQSHLSDLSQNAEYAPYITQSNGMYTINHTAVQNSGKKGELYDYLIPSAKRYAKKAAISAQTIELHPADPSKFDASLIRNVISNATVIALGEDAFSGEDLGKLKQIAQGDENLKNVFDMGIKYKLEIINNQEFYRVTIPVKKSLTGENPTSMAKQFDIDFEGKVSQANGIDFIVPAAAMDRIAGSDQVTINGVTGQKQVVRNDLRTLLSQSMELLDVTPPTSWVSNNGLLDDNYNYSTFPTYLSGMIGGGQISRSGNDLVMDFTKFDGTIQHINFTDVKGITYDQYKQSPDKYDSQLRTYVEGLVNDYALGNLNAAEQKNTIDRTTTNKIPWDKIITP